MCFENVISDVLVTLSIPETQGHRINRQALRIRFFSWHCCTVPVLTSIERHNLYIDGPGVVIVVPTLRSSLALQYRGVYRLTRGAPRRYTSAHSHKDETCQP